MSLEYNKELIPRAKELRKNMTRQEKHLWYDYLSAYPVRFQRQKTIGSFIVDFFCAKAKLVVELDGGHHYTGQGKAYDFERTLVLMADGIEVLRFSDSDVDRDFEMVCRSIDCAVQRRLLRTLPQSAAQTAPSKREP
ncbi:MAG: endonuclease domain-containing protein [Ruminococcus bromii]|nr:endonuclease domain-containing protein [Ruminococcus bromii]